MSKHIEIFEREKIVAIIRTDNLETAINAVKASIEGGIQISELTMTIPGALEGIKELKKEGHFVGIGTIHNSQQAEKAIEAGADFIVMPYLDKDVIKVSKEADKIVIPGVMTPTEAMEAYKCGADMLKIFPANCVGGHIFIKSLLGPFPFFKMLATGGINEDTFIDYLKSGASCVGIGGTLFKQEWLKNKDFNKIKEKAKSIIEKRNSI